MPKENTTSLYLTGKRFGKTALLGGTYQFIDGMISIPADNVNAINMVKKYYGAVESKNDAIKTTKVEGTVDVPPAKPAVDVPPAKPAVDVPPAKPAVDVPPAKVASKTKSSNAQ